MTCERALQALLEAEPSELEGRVDTPLSRHLGTCERCRARARALADDLGLLDRTLDELAGVNRGPASPELDHGTAARRAIADAREREGRRSGRDRSVPPDGRAPDGAGASKRGWLRTAVPLAAAAVLALVYVVGEPPPPPAGWEPPSPSSPPTATAPGVEPGQDAGTVAVFETSDPDITVVWFFQEE